MFGWKAYLGHAPGDAQVAPYAAPARRQDLSELPPAWLGVGTCDLFHDEDVEYARRLQAQGVPCELVTVPGAFHGFDAVVRGAQVSRDFRASYVTALRRAMHPKGAA